MSVTESIRIRVEPGFKEDVVRMYRQRGTTVSQAVRAFLSAELAAYSAPVDAFDAIMASADSKREASGLPEPTIEEINDYVARVRSERAAHALANA